jgi:hypothetical protein
MDHARMNIEHGIRTAKGTGSKVGATLFGLIFGSIGLFIAIMATRDGLADRQTQSWAPTPCTVEAVAAVGTSEGYRLELKYRYSHEDTTYHGTHYNRNSSYTFSDVATRQQLLTRYAKDSTHTCYVNPAAPAEAVLKQSGSNGRILLPIAFCSIFILIGYGMAIGAWLPRRARRAKTATASKTGGAARGRIFLIAFGALFVLIGLGVTYATFLKPWLQQQDAKQWVSTPATVLESTVRSHRGDDSTTYSVYIAYQYIYNGKSWVGDRFGFTGGSSSGSSGKRAIVKRYPKDHRFEVFVNPDSPAESVIQRDAGSSLFLGLIPIVFAVVGAIIILAVLRGTRTGSPQQRRARGPGHQVDVSDLETTFKPSSGHAGRILGTLFFALIWNGVVSIFVVEVVQDWMRGQKPIGTTLFMSIFLAVGIGAIIGFIYQCLRVFNPSLEIDAPPCTLTPGSMLSLPYHITGNIHKLTRITLQLTGTEHATYRRGTDTHTDREVFHETMLYETEGGMIMAQGTARLAIPADAMHSFKSSNNEVRWTLEVRGEIPRWPDLSESYALNVIPKELS